MARRRVLHNDASHDAAGSALYMLARFIYIERVHISALCTQIRLIFHVDGCARERLSFISARIWYYSACAHPTRPRINYFIKCAKRRRRLAKKRNADANGRGPAATTATNRSPGVGMIYRGGVLERKKYG